MLWCSLFVADLIMGMEELELQMQRQITISARMLLSRSVCLLAYAALLALCRVEVS